MLKRDFTFIVLVVSIIVDTCIAGPVRVVVGPALNTVMQCNVKHTAPQSTISDCDRSTTDAQMDDGHIRNILQSVQCCALSIHWVTGIASGQ